MSIYDELPADNFIRFLNYHNWYCKKKDGKVWVLVRATPEIKAFEVTVGSEEDNSWKEEAVKVISEGSKRSILSIAGDIAEFFE